ncbi:MAG TPA: peptidylprolyl isomerase [Verrucomicrobiae bacterium]|nr:peptidylprolyl isomerase [Verrucomicrobiae bacterium]
MKNKTSLILSGVLAAGLLGWLAVHAANSGAPMPADSTAAPDTNANPNAAMAALFGDPVIAQGKGFTIKQSELDEVTAAIKANYAAHGQTIPEDQLTQYEAMALNEFIDTKLLLQQANDADRAQGQQEADKAVTELTKEAGSLDALELRLKGSGKTLDQFRSQLADSTTANAALVRELGVSVSDADIKAFYDAHPSDFEQPEQVTVRHILFMTIDPTTHAPLSDDQKQAKLKQAQDVLKQLRDGADFAALATRYSDDPGSKENGGLLPAFGHGEMVAPFEAAAFSLTNNQISDIVTTEYGYHIIKLLDKTPAHKIELAKVSDNIKSYLLRQKLAPLAPRYLLKLKQDADVQILDDNLKQAVAAADASSTNPPPASAATP